MRVLVACEESQRVCIEMRKAGHEAYSCDTKQCSGNHPEWHIQGDCLEQIRGSKWDMIIAFPPCTHLCASGAQYWPQKREDGRQPAAVDFVMQIANADCPRIAIENPVGYLSTCWRKPDQMVHPYHFGDPYTKKTCLWLKGLPCLQHVDVVAPTHVWCSTSARSGPHKNGERKPTKLKFAKPRAGSRRSEIYSKTFPGIARAMAQQWGRDT